MEQSMNKAVFIDKDGTLIEDIPYNVDIEKITLSPGAAEGLKILETAGFKLIVISNQSGIARGLFSEGDVERVGEHLKQLTGRFGVHLSGFYFCPHHPDGTIDRYRVTCSCRKPEPGLILLAAKAHNIDLSRSWFIGDILNDIEAGRKAGCRTILIDNGKETEWILTRDRIPHHIVSAVKEAAEIIRALSE